MDRTAFKKNSLHVVACHNREATSLLWLYSKAWDRIITCQTKGSVSDLGIAVSSKSSPLA